MTCWRPRSITRSQQVRSGAARRLKRLAALAVGLFIVTLAVVGVFTFLWHRANTAKLTAESWELTRS
jgi:nitrate reductase NapE component